MKNDGKLSETMFEMKIKSLGKRAYLHRITDTREVSRGKNKVIVKKTPADWVLTWERGMGYAEIKSCSSNTSFPFSTLTQGQVAAMHMQVAAGGNYWVFIHHKMTNQWYMLTGSMIVNQMKLGIKSIKWKEMECYKCQVMNNTPI